jgi:hypothetical protein
MRGAIVGEEIARVNQQRRDLDGLGESLDEADATRQPARRPIFSAARFQTPVRVADEVNNKQRAIIGPDPLFEGQIVAQYLRPILPLRPIAQRKESRNECRRYQLHGRLKISHGSTPQGNCPRAPRPALFAGCLGSKLVPRAQERMLGI